MSDYLVSYIINRLSEASTIRSLVLLFGAIFGYQISDIQVNYFVWILLGVIGLLGSILPDRIGNKKTRVTDKSTPPEPTPPGYVEPPKKDIEGWNDK